MKKEELLRFIEAGDQIKKEALAQLRQAEQGCTFWKEAARELRAEADLLHDIDIVSYAAGSKDEVSELKTKIELLEDILKRARANLSEIEQKEKDDAEYRASNQ